MKKNENTTVNEEEILSRNLDANPVKIFFLRNLIKIKNHIAIFPLLMSIVSMIVLTFNIPSFVNSCIILHNEPMNAFYFFCNVLLSILIVLSYLNASNRKVGKGKKIFFIILFFVLVGLSLLLDYIYLHDISVETQLYNSINQVTDDPINLYVASSLKFAKAHIICLYISLGLAIAEPFLQPLVHRIRIRV